MAVILTTRRKFLLGLGAASGALIAAPSIVRASSLMPVKVPAGGDGIALTSMAHPHNPLGEEEIREWFRSLAAAVARERHRHGEGPTVARYGGYETTFYDGSSEGELNLNATISFVPSPQKTSITDGD